MFQPTVEQRTELIQLLERICPDLRGFAVVVTTEEFANYLTYGYKKEAVPGLLRAIANHEQKKINEEKSNDSD